MAVRHSPHVTRDELSFEPSPRRVRAELGGATVVDSRRPLVVWEAGKVVPVYAFPREDVREHALPEGAARGYDDPDLAGHLTLDWQAMDAWYEEDEEVFVHPRDPYKRVDVLQSSRHVRVEIDDRVVAETTRPRLLFETGLPTRYYIPQDDVRMELLAPTDHHSRCPYKGLASYWSAGDDENIAWSYLDPIPEQPKIRGLIAFFNERVDLHVDGELQERPITQWSPGRS